jgi:rRNA maturation endonuclease Nob1
VSDTQRQTRFDVICPKCKNPIHKTKDTEKCNICGYMFDSEDD